MEERQNKKSLKTRLRTVLNVFAHAAATVSIASTAFISLKSFEIYKSLNTSVKNEVYYNFVFDDLKLSNQYRAEIAPITIIKKIRIAKADRNIVALGEPIFDIDPELLVVAQKINGEKMDSEKDIFAMLTEKFDQIFLVKHEQAPFVKNESVAIIKKPQVVKAKKEYPVIVKKNIQAKKNIQIKKNIQSSAIGYSGIKKELNKTTQKQAIQKITIDIRTLLPKIKPHKEPPVENKVLIADAKQVTRHYVSALNVGRNYQYKDFIPPVVSSTTLIKQVGSQTNQADLTSQGGQPSKGSQTERTEIKTVPNTQSGNKITVIGYPVVSQSSAISKESVKESSDTSVRLPEKKEEPPVVDNKTDNKAEEIITNVQTTEAPTDICLLPINLAGFSGKVVSAFSGARDQIVEAKVQILGTHRFESTDSCGFFSFKDIKSDGVLPVEITAGDYKRRIAILKKDKTETYEMVSRDMAKMSAAISSENQADESGYLFVEIEGSKSKKANNTVEIYGLVTPKIIYIDEFGKPNRTLTRTSVRGQFVAHDLRPGTYLLNISGVTDKTGAEEFAPHLIQVSKNEGIVEKISLGEKRTIVGLVTESTTGKEVSDAKIRLLGNSKEVLTDKHGVFVLKDVNVDCDSLSYLQVNGEDYYANRIEYTCGDDQVKIFVSNKNTVEKHAARAGVLLNSASGILLGHLDYKKSVKAQLWGHDEQAHGNGLKDFDNYRGFDYYIDSNGEVNDSRNRTSKSGNFVIFESPEGLSYLQVFDKNGNILSYWPVFLSASTVNIHIQ